MCNYYLDAVPFKPQITSFYIIRPVKGGPLYSRPHLRLKLPYSLKFVITSNWKHVSKQPIFTHSLRNFEHIARIRIQWLAHLYEAVPFRKPYTKDVQRSVSIANYTCDWELDNRQTLRVRIWGLLTVVQSHAERCHSTTTILAV